MNERIRWCVHASIAGMLVSTNLAWAGSDVGEAKPPAQESAGLTWSLGAAFVSLPRYPGSDRQRTVLVPAIEARYRNYFFDPVKGLGVELPVTEALSLSASIGIALEARRAKDSPLLDGLPDVRENVAARLGLHYEAGRAFVDAAAVSRLVASRGKGSFVEADVGINVVAGPEWGLSLGVTGRAADASYFRTFYGIDAEQSRASGLRVYDAGSGLVTAGVFAQGFVPVSDRWSLFARVQASRLQDGAADSPVTQRRLLPFLLVTLTREFR